MKSWNAGVFLSLLAMSVSAFPQPYASQKDLDPGVRCQREVREYLQTLNYIHATAGRQIGERVAAEYVSEEKLIKVSREQGPCAAAQLIRARGARRG